MDDNAEGGAGQDFPLDEQIDNVARLAAQQIQDYGYIALRYPDLLTWLRQPMALLTAYYALSAQQRTHKHLVEIARALPLVPTETVLLDTGHLVAQQAAVEAGEKICSYLPDELHWFVWRMLFPSRWRAIDRQDYKGRIERIRVRAKPGVKALEDQDHLAILAEWLPYHTNGYSQEQFRVMKGWESRKPLSNALRWWKSKTGYEFPEGFEAMGHNAAQKP